jgi:hypothetical protein
MRNKMGGTLFHHGKWEAKITRAGVVHRLGRFESQEDAIQAVAEARIRLGPAVRTQRKFNEHWVENGDLIVDVSTKALPNTLARISFEDIGVLSDGGGRWAARSVGEQIYVSRRSNGKGQYLHRILLQLDLGDGDLVDHINGDCLDNRRENLRVTNKSTNAKNCKKSSANTTGFVGVTHDKRHGVYYAGLKDKGAYIHCGTFKAAAEAAEARLAEQMRRGFTERHGQ